MDWPRNAALGVSRYVFGSEGHCYQHPLPSCSSVVIMFTCEPRCSEICSRRWLL
jgi:hypothetical protein